jgi:hypothetical protein
MGSLRSHLGKKFSRSTMLRLVNESDRPLRLRQGAQLAKGGWRLLTHP